MHWAVLGSQVPVLEFLLSKGAYPDAYDSNDDAPLHLAARYAAQHVDAPLTGKQRRSPCSGTHCHACAHTHPHNYKVAYFQAPRRLS